MKRRQGEHVARTGQSGRIVALAGEHHRAVQPECLRRAAGALLLGPGADEQEARVGHGPADLRRCAHQVDVALLGPKRGDGGDERRVGRNPQGRLQLAAAGRHQCN